MTSLSPSTDTLEALANDALPKAEALTLLRALAPDKITQETFSELHAQLWATRIETPGLNAPVMDCCGTGGSGLAHYNTSTTAAFVLAAAGVPVVKFGNRAASSISGSFDFLSALGLPESFPLDRLPDLLNDCGIAFLYAPQVYPQLAGLAPLRRQLWEEEGLRTVFNYLGPLLNPVAPAYRLLGVSHPGMQTLLATTLLQNESNHHSWVVCAEGGLDEVSSTGTTYGLSVRRGAATSQMFEIMPPAPSVDQPTSLPPAESSRTYTPKENVAIFNALIDNDPANACPQETQMVLVNAAAGLQVAGLAEDLATGVMIAGALLQAGKVAETVASCRRAYARFA